MSHCFKDPVSSHWEYISTLLELFDISCKSHSDRFFLGTKRLIAREVEKLHLGDYEWKTFGETLEAVCSFASGLVRIGHRSEERVASFADTREEWFVALQGCFRRNVTVVTIYSSLGEEDLCHSLNEVSANAEVLCTACIKKKTLKKLSKQQVMGPYAMKKVEIQNKEQLELVQEESVFHHYSLPV